MKNRKEKIILLLLIPLVAFLLYVLLILRGKFIMEKYISQCAAYYPEELLDHFPSKFSLNTFYEIYYPTRDAGGGSVVIIHDLKRFRKYLMKLEKESCGSVHSTDPCIFVIGAYIDEQMNILETLNEGSCFEYPVLDVNGYFYEYDEPSDWEIYLIESKKEQCTEDMYVRENQGLPGNWDHGFTRGVSVSREYNKIAFWLQLW